MASDDESWLDDAAGQLVRPYSLPGGPTADQGRRLDVAAYVRTAGDPESDHAHFQPEHRSVLRVAHVPVSVADLASQLDLPLGVLRVLLDDLLDAELVEI